MHTSFQLRASYFQISVDGCKANAAQLFPSWSEHDRLGVIIDRPLGAIGASLLIQLAITMFYDASPDRRKRQIYPEVYFFHKGGRYGDFSYFDVFPTRKEVFLPDNPAETLESINDRAITRLCVVDKSTQTTKHYFKERAAALDRIRSAFAYSPTGRTPGSDVTITPTNRRATLNTNAILDPKGRGYAEMLQASARDAENLQSINVFDQDTEVMRPTQDRSDETSEQQRKVLKANKYASGKENLPPESYRRISVEDALSML